MADKPVLWVIASGNPGKQREISQILKAMNLEVEGFARFAPVSFPEEGLDYRENAIAKAMAVAPTITAKGQREIQPILGIRRMSIMSPRSAART